jgi:hypothetical protein
MTKDEYDQLRNHMPNMCVYELIAFHNALLDQTHLPNGQKWVIIKRIKEKLIEQKKASNVVLNYEGKL